MPPGLSAREPNPGLFFTHRKGGSVTDFPFPDPLTQVGRLFMTSTDIGAATALRQALGD